MTDEPDDGSLDQIVAPPLQPGESVADDLATKEVEDFNRASRLDKLKPNAKVIFLLERQMQDLRTDLSESRRECRRVSQELDDLRPAYAQLHQYSKTDRLVSIIATIGMAVGGALMGCVGLPKTETGRSACFGSGVALLAVGAAVMIFGHAIGPTKIIQVSSLRFFRK